MSLAWSVCSITMLAVLNIAQNEASYTVTVAEGETLHGCIFQQTTETVVANCLARCLENCVCRSFKKCEGENTCSLCLFNDSAVALTANSGCTSFVLERKTVQNAGMAKKSCLQDTNCCLTSRPCLNGGTCQPTFPSEILHTPRFKCACPPGYRGDRCEKPMKSCRGYLHRMRSDTPSGNYTIIDENNKSFLVFCDFTWNNSDSTRVAWTLIQSYELRNKENVSKPFFQDAPQNSETPNWRSYRLSRTRMHSIQNDSTKWRMTCQYGTEGLNRTDYVEGLKRNVDILVFNGSECKRVEFINVRGYGCEACEALIRQKDTKAFHHDSLRSYERCMFKPNESITCKNSSRSEDNFGWYKCANERHRCSRDAGSTSQTWLGGELSVEI